MPGNITQHPANEASLRAPGGWWQHPAYQSLLAHRRSYRASCSPHKIATSKGSTMATGQGPALIGTLLANQASHTMALLHP